MREWIERRSEELYETMVNWRRHLHRNPELSFQEEQTAHFVKERLEPLGLEVRTGIGGHGITALLCGGRPGPTVALRADMDALPIQDEKTTAYASQVPGVMHACGHDGHTSILLAAAIMLSEIRDKLAGSVKFIFQPAEEVTPGGAKPMIEAGVLDGVDVIYGIHLWTPFPAGTAATRVGPVMAATDEFQIEIRGKGGHGGLPHAAVDSLVIGAHLVVNLQSVVSRSLNPIEPGVVTVGMLEAGRSFNVIADMCRMKGTVRTFDGESRALIRRRVEEIASHTCSMFGAEHTLDYKLGYPALVNHAAETERFTRVAAGMLGSNAIIGMSPMMAAEDFAYYLERVPGCFLFVGAGAENARHPHHHPRFDFDESAMKTAVRLFAAVTLDYLTSPAETL